MSLKEEPTMVIIFPAIFTVIFFYYSGKNKARKGISWAFIGLFGYVLAFSLGMAVIGETFISIFIALATVYLTHVQLTRNALKNRKNS